MYFILPTMRPAPYITKLCFETQTNQSLHVMQVVQLRQMIRGRKEEHSYLIAIGAPGKEGIRTFFIADASKE